MRIILLATLASLGLVGSARAEHPEGVGASACRLDDETQPVGTRVEMINGKPTLVIEKAIVVCGRPARPAVAYVTGPKDVDYTWSEALIGALAPKPASKIVESVSKLGGRK